MMAKLWPFSAIVSFGLAYSEAAEPPSKPLNPAGANEVAAEAKSAPPKTRADGGGYGSGLGGSGQRGSGYGGRDHGGRDYGLPGGQNRKPDDAAPNDQEKSARPTAEQPLEPPTAEISRWIGQLDSNEYWTREEASKRLFRAGRAAITALGDAARSPKLEVSTRAVGVLSQFLEFDDPQVELAAETILEEIAASRVTSAAARAETALAGYREGRQERSLNKLRELGASVASSALNGEIALVQVTIGEGWRGDTQDLAILKRLPSLQRLSIYEDNVDDRALKHLTPLKQLTYLELFGTRISDEGIERLKEKLTSTQIDRRKGGLLGVMGDRSARGGGCLVTTVQPGTAADKAGLEPGDVIVKFEGKDVTDFLGLTELISAKAGGETVELEIERQTQVGEKIEKQRLTKKATLDQWKTRMTLNTVPGDIEIIIGR